MIGSEIIQRSAFDYEGLEAGARAVVKDRTAEIHGLIRMTAQTVVKIGCKLAEVKPLLEGRFCAWLQAEFTWSERAAMNFINVYKTFGGEPSISNFAPSALYLLSAPKVPEEARKTAIKIAAGGETVTHKKAKSLISHRAGMPKAKDVDRDQEPEPAGMLSRLNGEPGVKDCPQMFYVNRLTVIIRNDELDFREDRLTYALHGLADLIKERVPRHPPK